MKYGGWVYKPDEKEQQKKLGDRFNEIKNIKGIKIEKTPRYAQCRFKGELLTDEAKQLSEMDLLIFADSGNLCFGGECFKGKEHFSGTYFTD